MSAALKLQVINSDVIVRHPQDIVGILSTELTRTSWTFQQIAKATGLSPNTISRVFYREVNNPQVRTQLELLTFFGYELIVKKR